MNKYQILLEYVGTKYVGWQSQKNGRSIQNTVQLYLSKLLKKKLLSMELEEQTQAYMQLSNLHIFIIKKKLTNIPKLIKSLNFFLNKKRNLYFDHKKKKYKFSC